MSESDSGTNKNEKSSSGSSSDQDPLLVTSHWDEEYKKILLSYYKRVVLQIRFREKSFKKYQTLKYILFAFVLVLNGICALSSSVDLGIFFSHLTNSNIIYFRIISLVSVTISGILTGIWSQFKLEEKMEKDKVLFDKFKKLARRIESIAVYADPTQSAREVIEKEILQKLAKYEARSESVYEIGNQYFKVKTKIISSIENKPPREQIILEVWDRMYHQEFHKEEPKTNQINENPQDPLNLTPDSENIFSKFPFFKKNVRQVNFLEV
jgi:hypothetical protein